MARPVSGADDRAPAPLAIDEGQFVGLNGVDQWVTIRGRDLLAPPLLILSGTGAAFSMLASLFAPWEGDFTLVQWDQPGAGATFARNGAEATGPLSLERIARDGIAVADWARQRLGGRRIALLGVSGGSILGLMMVKARPDLFSVYVGSGQVVDWAAQATASYALVLENARRAGDAEALTAMQAIGPPPYADTATDAIKSRYANAMTPGERAAFAAGFAAPGADARYVAKGLPQHDPFAVAMAVYEALREEITTFDARRLGLTFAVPMVFLQGDLDVFTVTAAVAAYAAEIRTPKTAFALVEGGGHSAVFMAQAFLALLREYVRPLAASA